MLFAPDFILYRFSGRQFTKEVRQALGKERIEDLWLRYFCITTNVRRMEQNVHRCGPVAQLVRASMTVLGLFPPMIYNGDVHIDGGYVNNIPVDVMVEQGHCGTIIAVDVEDKDM
jgi:lysophospholipid hydrolase